MIIDITLEEKVQKICEQFNAICAFYFVRDKNTSNNLPYHNWYHALCMVEKCVEGADYHNLPYRSIRHLIMAALFHDYEHSGGKEIDSINIDRAVRGWKTYAYAMLREMPSIDIQEVEHIIEVTEYPYVREPICIEQKIIRDADLMQSFRPSWEEMIIDGLREEMSIKHGVEITKEEMCDGQIAFLKKVRALSDWGYHEMFEENKIQTALNNVSNLRYVIGRSKK